jgi:hypothetical protein
VLVFQEMSETSRVNISCMQISRLRSVRTCTVILIDGLETRKVQYNSLTMLLSSFMQEFGPISSRVYCIFAQ